MGVADELVVVSENYCWTMGKSGNSYKYCGNPVIAIIYNLKRIYSYSIA